MSAIGGSAYRAQRLFVQGPCFSVSSDSVQLRFRRRATLDLSGSETNASAATLLVPGVVLSAQAAVFRQPVLPELPPGRYRLSLVLNGLELSNATADFHLCMRGTCSTIRSGLRLVSALFAYEIMEIFTEHY